ncbi:MAG: glycosyl hydrolase, partial [Bacteroidota bacterium]
MNNYDSLTKGLVALLLAFLIFPNLSFAQKKKRQKAKASALSSIKQEMQTTAAAERMEGFEKRVAMRANSPFRMLSFRNVGPSVMSGRVVDLDVNPANPAEFWVAYASGGLWKTTSNGNDFTPYFEQEASMTLGDIAVDWSDGQTIWVGTGENNSSRSSYSGTGIYKSTDGGKSFTHMGLPESHHISRIILHPNDKNTVWVAVLGHLYSKNPERGVYKTTDGGKSWTKTLFVDDNSGAVDLIIDPSNPQALYAATWDRMRQAWHFEGSGEGSGIFKSTDGGDSWTKIASAENGFRTGKGVGRIGLAISAASPNTIFAIHDSQDRRPAEDKKSDDGLTKEKLREMTASTFQDLDQQSIHDFLDKNGFPQKYNAKQIKADMEAGKLAPSDLVEYIEDANRLLFDTPVIGAEVYRSDDGGKNWSKTHDNYLDGLYSSYGYYFGQIRVSDVNPDHLYIFGVPFLQSKDGGKNWKSMGGPNVHSDHHAMWINPNLDGHVIIGNDGGVNISYNDGESWYKCNGIPVGQFYSVNVDMAEPYNIYGGLQDNGVWVGPSSYAHSLRWNSSGQYPYRSIMGGDGMQVEIDTRDNETVYTGFQFGNYFRLNRNNGQRKFITPKHSLGESPYRWNWQSPIQLSHHNQDVVYFGSNHFHRSLNQGDDFETLSEDLTRGGKKGNVPYGTLTSISESPKKFGLIYVGS